MIKPLLLATLCATLVLPFSGALAQGNNPLPRSPIRQQAPAADELDGNYVLTLVSSRKDQPASELSVVVAAPNFSSSSSEPTTSLSGTCSAAGDGTFLVSYALNRTVAMPTGPNSTQYRNVNTQASVRLHPGETARIIKDGDQIYTLKLDRYQPEAK